MRANHVIAGLVVSLVASAALAIDNGVAFRLFMSRTFAGPDAGIYTDNYSNVLSVVVNPDWSVSGDQWDPTTKVVQNLQDASQYYGRMGDRWRGYFISPEIMEYRGTGFATILFSVQNPDPALVPSVPLVNGGYPNYVNTFYKFTYDAATSRYVQSTLAAGKPGDPANGAAPSTEREGFQVVDVWGNVTGHKGAVIHRDRTTNAWGASHVYANWDENGNGDIADDPSEYHLAYSGGYGTDFNGVFDTKIVGSRLYLTTNNAEESIGIYRMTKQTVDGVDKLVSTKFFTGSGSTVANLYQEPTSAAGRVTINGTRYDAVWALTKDPNNGDAMCISRLVDLNNDGDADDPNENLIIFSQNASRPAEQNPNPAWTDIEYVATADGKSFLMAANNNPRCMIAIQLHTDGDWKGYHRDTGKGQEYYVATVGNGSLSELAEDFTVDPQIVTGDMNNSGATDNEDIKAFVTALTNPASYKAGGVNWVAGLDANVLGDINQSGDLDNEDIRAFVDKVIHGSPNTMPEPATMTLLALGGLALLRRRSA